jgi:predicted regulator of Ras-like GTPase activity (Roadblock/LC7/MglB family)
METVQHALATLMARPEVAGAALVSAEGLLVAAHLPAGADPEALAALAVTLARTARQLAAAGGQEVVNRLVIEGGDSMTIAMPVIDGALLVLLTSPGAPAGQLLFDLRQSRGNLAALL